MLKESINLKSTSDVNLSTFERYLKAMNNPSDPFLTPDEDVLFFNEGYVQSELQIMFRNNTVRNNNKAVRQLKGKYNLLT